MDILPPDRCEAPIDQGDCGLCDACGSEDGDRTPHTTTITISGKPVRVVSYLCRQCIRSAIPVN